MTDAAKAALFAQQTNQVFLILLTIDHETLSESIRVVNNTQNIESNGETFLAFPFKIDFPDDVEDGITNARLTIDNVDRSIVRALRTIQSPPSVTIAVVMASDPDVVEAELTDLTLRGTSYNAKSVSGELIFEDILSYSYPRDKMSPANCPGLF